MKVYAFLLYIVVCTIRCELQFISFVFPRLVDQTTLLLVKWKPSAVNRTVCHRPLKQWLPKAETVFVNVYFLALPCYLIAACTATFYSAKQQTLELYRISAPALANTESGVTGSAYRAG